MKRSLILLLTAVLCLILSACDKADNDVTDDDWRVFSAINGSGTITHDGEGSVDVLVMISPEKAAFYRNKPEQILFDSVSFPMTITDAEQAFNAISFDDLDGDGGSDVTVKFIHENGNTTELVWIWDNAERYVFREDLSTIMIGNGIEEYVGLWEYMDDLWLRIHEDATWELVNDQDDIIKYGTLRADESVVTLYFAGSGEVLHLDHTVSGDLIDSVNGATLIPVESIQSSQPYFTRNGLQINAEMDMGTFFLEDGVCTHTGFGDGYNTGDCYWELIKHSDYAYNGIRQIEFDAICYIPESSIPDFDEQYLTNTDSELYDFYTGMWLTASTTYGNSDRGENYYLHTINWEGNSYPIEFFYSTDWQHDVDGWETVFTKSYTVYLPEEYDGLVFAAEAQPDNYKDSDKRMHLDSICPEAGVMEITTVNPYRSLYFRVYPID